LEKVFHPLGTPDPHGGVTKRPIAMNSIVSPPRAEIVRFDDLTPVQCPCGMARRAFTERDDLPFTFHRTQITEDARTHYHRTLTETYYILECGPDAAVELDGRREGIRAGDCIVIPPETRHRAVGRMTVLIVVFPKFDPADEWFDD
jgi:mannose-6-phosphate isomerase-like protein (cupin superfamily)